MVSQESIPEKLRREIESFYIKSSTSWRLNGGDKRLLEILESPDTIRYLQTHEMDVSGRSQIEREPKWERNYKIALDHLSDVYSQLKMPRILRSGRNLRRGLMDATCALIDLNIDRQEMNQAYANQSPN